jgi:hypothetical protein
VNIAPLNSKVLLGPATVAGYHGRRLLESGARRLLESWQYRTFEGVGLGHRLLESGQARRLESGQYRTLEGVWFGHRLLESRQARRLESGGYRTMEGVSGTGPGLAGLDIVSVGGLFSPFGGSYGAGHAWAGLDIVSVDGLMTPFGGSYGIGPVPSVVVSLEGFGWSEVGASLGSVLDLEPGPRAVDGSGVMLGAGEVAARLSEASGLAPGTGDQAATRDPSGFGLVVATGEPLAGSEATPAMAGSVQDLEPRQARDMGLASASVASLEPASSGDGVVVYQSGIAVRQDLDPFRVAEAWAVAADVRGFEPVPAPDRSGVSALVGVADPVLDGEGYGAALPFLPVEDQDTVLFGEVAVVSGSVASRESVATQDVGLVMAMVVSFSSEALAAGEAAPRIYLAGLEPAGVASTTGVLAQLVATAPWAWADSGGPLATVRDQDPFGIREDVREDVAGGTTAILVISGDPIGMQDSAGVGLGSGDPAGLADLTTVAALVTVFDDEASLDYPGRGSDAAILGSVAGLEPWPFLDRPAVAAVTASGEAIPGLDRAGVSALAGSGEVWVVVEGPGGLAMGLGESWASLEGLGGVGLASGDRGASGDVSGGSAVVAGVDAGRGGELAGLFGGLSGLDAASSVAGGSGFVSSFLAYSRDTVAAGDIQSVVAYPGGPEEVRGRDLGLADALAGSGDAWRVEHGDRYGLGLGSGEPLAVAEGRGGLSLGAADRVVARLGQGLKAAPSGLDAFAAADLAGLGVATWSTDVAAGRDRGGLVPAEAWYLAGAYEVVEVEVDLSRPARSLESGGRRLLESGGALLGESRRPPEGLAGYDPVVAAPGPGRLPWSGHTLARAGFGVGHGLIRRGFGRYSVKKLEVDPTACVIVDDGEGEATLVVEV